MSVVNYVCAYFLSPSTWWWSYYTTLQKENHSYNNVHNNNNLNTWIFASNILNNDDDTLLHTGTHPPHSYNQYILSSRFIHIWKSKIFSIFSYFAYIFFRTKEKKNRRKTDDMHHSHVFNTFFFIDLCFSFDVVRDRHHDKMLFKYCVGGRQGPACGVYVYGDRSWTF